MRRTSIGIIFAIPLWTAFGCGSSEGDQDVGGSSSASETPSDGAGGGGGRTAIPGSTAGSAGSEGEGGEVTVGALIGSQEPSVPCGPLTCSGENSICCWDWVSSTGECLSDASGCPSYALACDSGSDCGAEYCCAGSFSTECLEACAPGMVAYCASPSDCPALADQVVSCEPINDESLPFSTGYCLYGF